MDKTAPAMDPHQTSGGRGIPVADLWAPLVLQELSTKASHRTQQRSVHSAASAETSVGPDPLSQTGWGGGGLRADRRVLWAKNYVP